MQPINQTPQDVVLELNNVNKRIRKKQAQIKILKTLLKILKED